ncbi:hypothetical protein LINGRAHAP2_LOCUS36908 [Linum grandiflorum]
MTHTMIGHQRHVIIDIKTTSTAILRRHQHSRGQGGIKTATDVAMMTNRVASSLVSEDAWRCYVAAGRWSSAAAGNKSEIRSDTHDQSSM